MMGEILRELQLMAVEASVVIVRDVREYEHLLPSMSRKSFVVSCFIHIDFSTFVSNYCGDILPEVVLTFRSRS
jgi:hypothetical protein